MNDTYTDSWISCVDLSAPDRRQTAAIIRTACEDSGFFIISGFQVRVVRRRRQSRAGGSRLRRLVMEELSG